MNKTLCITFPRSGHHLLVNILCKYFSNDVTFQEIQGDETTVHCRDVIIAGDFKYCEFYNHCQSIPCSHADTTFTKNHDFGFNVRITDRFNYLVLYRHPIASIVSWYEYILNTPLKNAFTAQMFVHKLEETREAWEYFAQTAMRYWKDFMHKWFIHNKKPIYALQYESLVSRTNLSLIGVIHMLEPEKEIDIQHLCKCIDALYIKKRRNLQNFRFYDANFFRRMEEGVKSEINYAGIQRIF